MLALLALFGHVIPVNANWEPAPVRIISENEPVDNAINTITEGPVPDDYEDSLPNEKVVLNADRVFFNDETGNATAEGEAVLTYGSVTIEAERIDYDANTQRVDAMSLPNEKVKLRNGQYFIDGDHLNYDLVTGEGILNGSTTKIAIGEGSLFVYGDNLTVIPWDIAVQQGLVGNQKGTPEDYVAQWNDVAITTCTLDHPHYRLESQKISFVPGSSVVAKKPKVYLGNTYLFTSPFDYTMSLRRRFRHFSLLPYVRYTNAGGSGLGMTGVAAWETGSFALGIGYANKGGMQWLFEVEQDLSEEFNIRVGVEYSWDEAWDESIWRPHASLVYQKNDWTATLNWMKDEYISDGKDSRYEYKGRLNRQPEFVINSPWYKTGTWSWLSLEATLGSYREETPNNGNSKTQATNRDTQRAGLELQNYFEKDLSPTVQLFSKTNASVWAYDHDDADQETIWTFTGLRYNIGNLELGTAYERRFVWGNSAMIWDSYRERERIHQKLRFPLGREVYTMVRGSYDLDESMVDEAVYSLQWVTDCMKWELYMLDDYTSSNDDKIGLSLSILAFPNTRVAVGQSVIEDPFDPPEGLRGKVKGKVK